MPFQFYLSIPQLQQLTQAASDTQFPLLVPRALLVQGLPPGFANAAFNPNTSPLLQFQVDLNRFNHVERLENGLVPVVEFLSNAAFQLKLLQLPQSAIFEKLANLLGNRACGVTALPDPALLPEIIKPEAIVGTDDMVDFSFLAQGAAAGRSVARILVPRFENGIQARAGNGPWLMVGTAWLIAPRLAVTNLHVIEARRDDEPRPAPADLSRQALASSLEFDFDARGANPVPVAVAALLASDSGLDYALLELASDPARPALRLAPQPVVHTPTSSLAVNIIQHPRGEPKRVALRNNLVTAADPQTIRYFTDTDFGSSGSPVCDDLWQVVALHRGARHVDGVSFHGRPTAFVNFGSQIRAVLDHARALAPTALQALP